MLTDKNANCSDTRCTAHEAGRKVREVIDHATHDVRDAAAMTEQQIRENPVKASAIAAGIGFVLGLLFRRR